MIVDPVMLNYRRIYGFIKGPILWGFLLMFKIVTFRAVLPVTTRTGLDHGIWQTSSTLIRSMSDKKKLKDSARL
jgi:hypothetical protein